MNMGKYRFALRLPGGLVLECDDADDLEDALRAIRVVDDLRRLPDGTIVAQTAAAIVAYERELHWDHRRAAALLKAIRGGQRRILGALVELGHDVPVRELADTLGCNASGLGPSLAAIGKRARDLFPGSPPPLQSYGEPGKVMVRGEPMFIEVLRLLLPTHAQLE